MKKYQPIAIVVLFIMAFSLSFTTAEAKTPQKNNNPIKALTSSGEIAGTVQCGEEGVEGALVYIPGLSFMAKTGDDGKFLLSYVPAGDYDLMIEAGDQYSEEIQDVNVAPKEVTDLGVISISVCSDTSGESLDEGTNNSSASANPYGNTPY